MGTAINSLAVRAGRRTVVDGGFELGGEPNHGPIAFRMLSVTPAEGVTPEVMCLAALTTYWICLMTYRDGYAI
jgi:hypothetical protein